MLNDLIQTDFAFMLEAYVEKCFAILANGDSFPNDKYLLLLMTNRLNNSFESILIKKMSFIYSSYKKNMGERMKEALFPLLYKGYTKIQASNVNRHHADKSTLVLMWMLIVDPSNDFTRKELKRHLADAKLLDEEYWAFFYEYVFRIPYLYIIKEQLKELFTSVKYSQKLIEAIDKTFVEVKTKRPYEERNESSERQLEIEDSSTFKAKTSIRPRMTKNFGIITPQSIKSCFEKKVDSSEKDSSSEEETGLTELVISGDQANDSGELERMPQKDNNEKKNNKGAAIAKFSDVCIRKEGYDLDKRTEEEENRPDAINRKMNFYYNLFPEKTRSIYLPNDDEDKEEEDEEEIDEDLFLTSLIKKMN